jgi:cytochrome c peroxidase
MMKVPTLRNVDKRPSSTFVKAYGHNGYFKSLNSIVRFYAWRSMMNGGMGMGGNRMGGNGMGGMCGGMMFGEPEVNANLAELNMFRCMDSTYIVTFLQTLSDGYYIRK